MKTNELIQQLTRLQNHPLWPDLEVKVLVNGSYVEVRSVFIQVFWEPGSPQLVCIGLQPATASETRLDVTGYRDRA